MQSLLLKATYAQRYLLEGPTTRHGTPHYMVVMPDNRTTVTFKNRRTKTYVSWPLALKHLRAKVVGSPAKVKVMLVT